MLLLLLLLLAYYARGGERDHKLERMSQLQACRGAYIICRASPMILCGVELLRAQHLLDPVFLLTALIIIAPLLSSLLTFSFGTRILRGLKITFYLRFTPSIALSRHILGAPTPPALRTTCGP